MSTQLETNLQNILDQKETYLLPENLKAGITCLGVTGTNRNNIKLFPTVAAMNADTDKQDGDLAIVYSKSAQPVRKNVSFNNVQFKRTIVFDEAITEGIESGYRSMEDEPTITKDIEISTYISPDELSIDVSAYNTDDDTYWGCQLHYNSSDGLTYIVDENQSNYHTDSGSLDIDLLFTDFADFGVNITWNNTGEFGWHDIVSSFMFTNAPIFTGLYECNYTDDNGQSVLQYNFAKSQLTLNNTNQLLPGVTSYGSSGVITGSSAIYDNINVLDIVSSKNKLVNGFISVANNSNCDLTYKNELNIQSSDIVNRCYIATACKNLYNVSGSFDDKTSKCFATKNFLCFINMTNKHIYITNYKQDTIFLDLSLETENTNVYSISYFVENPNNPNSLDSGVFTVALTYTINTTNSGYTTFCDKIIIDIDNDSVVRTNLITSNEGNLRWTNPVFQNNNVYQGIRVGKTFNFYENDTIVSYYTLSNTSYYKFRLEYTSEGFANFSSQPYFSQALIVFSYDTVWTAHNVDISQTQSGYTFLAVDNMTRQLCMLDYNNKILYSISNYQLTQYKDLSSCGLHFTNKAYLITVNNIQYFISSSDIVELNSLTNISNSIHLQELGVDDVRVLDVGDSIILAKPTFEYFPVVNQDTLNLQGDLSSLLSNNSINTLFTKVGI